MRNFLVYVLDVPAAFLAMVAGVGFCALNYDGRQDIDLENWIGTSEWDQAMMPEARVATDEVCDDVPCIQAVDSRTLTMMKFKTQEKAAEWADRLPGHTYLSGWIVVHYKPGGLTPYQQEDFQSILECVNVGVGPQKQEC